MNEVVLGTSDPKRHVARIAAQTLVLALREARADVRVVVFADGGWALPHLEADRVFSTWASGGTGFLWLPEVWRRFPTYLVVLVTDGAGTMPLPLRSGVERTVGICIPEGDAGRLATVCRKVVKLDRVETLPQVLALLVPGLRR